MAPAEQGMEEVEGTALVPAVREWGTISLPLSYNQQKVSQKTTPMLCR